MGQNDSLNTLIQLIIQSYNQIFLLKCIHNPRFDRNLNTGGDQATGTQFQTAQQTVLHNSQFRSHILLPVIPS